MGFFTQVSPQIFNLVKAYEEIIRLDLPEKEKERYKKDVADFSKDFSTVLIEGKTAAKEKKIEKLRSSATSQKWSEEVLSEMIGELSDDGGNCDFLIRKGEIRNYLYEARDLSRSGQWSQVKSKLDTISLTVEEKGAFSEVASAKTAYEKAKNIEKELESASLKNIDSLKKKIDMLDIDGDAKKRLEGLHKSKEIELLKAGIREQRNTKPGFWNKQADIDKKIQTLEGRLRSLTPASEEADTSATGTETPASEEADTSKTGPSLPRPKAEELKVEVKEGNIIYVENNKKIEMERRTVAIGDISERNIVVGGKEVFLYEYEKKKEGQIEIRGYGEYGILPKLKSNNERVLARLYDRVLEGRERKEEGEVEGKGVGEDKGSQLFEKIGHLSVAEAYRMISKEVRGLSLIPNIVMSVGSEEERKYVYKNMGEREEGEENKIWIEGINEVKNYGEDENSVEKYSDNKVGTIIGYGREVGEGKYVGMYMKGSKHEIKQGAGNSGEVVNVGLGISGKYENKVEIKWLTYVGMNKCRTEIGWQEGNVKGEFSMGEVGIDVEGGLKIRSELIGIVKPYIGIGARKSSYDKVEEKGKMVDMKIEGGSYERCVGRIGVEGIREISKRVEIVGRVEYERVIKGEVAGVRLEGMSGKVLGVREGKDKVGVNVEGRYKIRKDVGVSGGLNGYKAEGYNEVGVNVGGWFKF